MRRSFAIGYILQIDPHKQPIMAPIPLRFLLRFRPVAHGESWMVAEYDPEPIGNSLLLREKLKYHD